MTTSATAAEPADRCDVLIAGGGLAGLTLALHLKQQTPHLSVVVLERRALPCPISAHKVGESTVEIGAHYFAEMLGLREHLQTEHLRKFGFRFFFSEGLRNFDRVVELGASHYLSVPTYQIDRGLFENHLAERVRAAGIMLVDDARVTAIDLNPAAGGGGRGQQNADPHADQQADHQVGWLRDGRPHRIRCRWVVDACGRASLLKRKLQLAQPNGHEAHAVWFRMDHRIAIDQWSDDPQWRARCTVPDRWLSTNHLCGEGYWVWLIPLSSGSHSVGIVADPAVHPLQTMDTFDKAMDWIERYQPRLFDELDPHRDTLQDFAFFRQFSYGCRKTFSDQRWALAGEAGRFLDPFYSPGSDFIAIGNTYIAGLIARDARGEPIRAAARAFDVLYRTFYENMLPLYERQYPLFGNAAAMSAKVLWDYTYYWSVLAPLFFHQRIDDLELLSDAAPDLATCSQLNEIVQAHFRRISPAAGPTESTVMFDQCRLDWFVELNRRLTEPQDADALRRGLAEAARLMQRLSREILEPSEAPPELLLTRAATSHRDFVATA